MEYYYIINRWDRCKTTYTLLELSGQWKLVYNPINKDPILYVGHRGTHFLEWISEDDICLGYKQEEFLNTCDSKFYEFGQTH